MRMLTAPQPDWFSGWFSSPYYPVLYGNRDEAEAAGLIEMLLRRLALAPGTSVLDLACGRGRHTWMLHRRQMQATGYDLSPEAIEAARRAYEGEGPQFRVHDMREPFPDRSFGAIFNLFTSFGYFSERQENLQVLAHVAEALAPQAPFVLDYFNIHAVLTHLVPYEEKTIRGISFRISRHLRGDKLFKTIHISDEGQEQVFTEQVQAFGIEDFASMFAQSGLSLEATWGDYEGREFSPQSPRLLLLARAR